MKNILEFFCFILLFLGVFLLILDFSKIENLWHHYTFDQTDKSIKDNNKRRNMFIMLTIMLSLFFISICIFIGGIGRLFGLH